MSDLSRPPPPNDVSDTSLDRLIPSVTSALSRPSAFTVRANSSLDSITTTLPGSTQARRVYKHIETNLSEIIEAVNFLHYDNELIYACETGNDDLVTNLIRQGVNVNTRDPIGRTALHFAVQNNSIETIILLLRAGADATIMDNVGLTPLSICLMRKPSVNVAKLLFQHGAVILPRISPVSTGLFLQFSMMCTPTEEEAEILALLIHEGALINDPDVPGGRSALHFAAMSNNCALIHILVMLGADLFAINHRFQTPLDVATIFQCKEAVKCLTHYISINPIVSSTSTSSVLETN